MVTFLMLHLGGLGYLDNNNSVGQLDLPLISDTDKLASVKTYRHNYDNDPGPIACYNFCGFNLNIN
jgi:hypothetical protein